jgi:translation initiation factor 3 subunit D
LDKHQLTYRYISRATPKDTTHHVIVGVQNYKPKDFAAQMNVSITNGWGIVRTIADLVLKQPEGKYVLVKDPNAVSTIAGERKACTDLQSIIRLYSVPENAFQAEEEDDN